MERGREGGREVRGQDGGVVVLGRWTADGEREREGCWVGRERKERLDDDEDVAMSSDRDRDIRVKHGFHHFLPSGKNCDGSARKEGFKADKNNTHA